MRYFLIFSLWLAAMQMSGCGAEPTPEPDQTVVITVKPDEVLCTDVVIWDRSAEADCEAAGGVYEAKAWPIGSTDQHMVCNFCPVSG